MPALFYVHTPIAGGSRLVANGRRLVANVFSFSGAAVSSLLVRSYQLCCVAGPLWARPRFFPVIVSLSFSANRAG
jgi:hypothetical protein